LHFSFYILHYILPTKEEVVFDRRRLLTRSLPAVALGAAPGFVARTARAAAPGTGPGTVLVVLEMTGGNDGLNTVVPYADDLYHKARPTLRLTQEQVVRVDDHVGLHPAMRPLEGMLKAGNLAVVQGVGYPNPDRSHFESMDVWQSGDPKRLSRTGWLGRGLGNLALAAGAVPAAHVGAEQLPLALAGAATGVPSVHPTRPFDLELELGAAPDPNAGRFMRRTRGEGTPDPKLAERRALIEGLAQLPQGPAGDLGLFVRRAHQQTFANVGRLRKLLDDERAGRGFDGTSELARNLSLVGRMIAADFGTRVFYLSVGSFDTHADQGPQHQRLLGDVAQAVAGFFAQLQQAKAADRVLLLTFSEFGRRVQENGSKGTDHGAGSCLFLAGPGAKGGAVGAHPSLSDLDNGDLKHHTDFRGVYAALLDGWLGCDSRAVLGGTFAPAAVLKKG
jgi:uncharacterized protein (DUF1501 family)